MNSKWLESFRIDLRALAMFRILTGILLVYDALDKVLKYKELFSDSGVLPRLMYVQNGEWSTFHSLFLISDSSVVTILLLLAQAACGVMMALRIRPRLAAFAGWVIFISGNARNPMIVYGADQIMRSVLLISAFCPLERSTLKGRGSFLSAPGAALLLQILFMYFVTGFLKTGPEWVKDFTAVHFTLRLNTYSSGFGRWLLDFPGLLSVLTVSVYWMELIAPWLLLVPARFWKLRTGLVLSFWGFHIGTALTMNLGFFPFICIAATSALLPAGLFDRLQKQSADLADFIRQPRFAQAAGWALIIFIVTWNGSMIAGKSPLRVPVLKEIGKNTFLWQHWNMFAPSPKKTTGWITVPGTLESGEAVDVLGLSKTVPADTMPVDLNTHLGGARWVRYYTYLFFEPVREQYLYYGRWLCRRWHSEFPDTKLKRFEIQLSVQLSNERLGVDPPVKKTVWTHECFR